MGRRRMAWLAAAPLLAGTAALMLGAAAASALAVVLAPYGTPAPGMLDAGRAVLASTLGDLTGPRQLAPVAVGVLLAELTWMVGLGLAAQRLFPRRRRAIPAIAAVVLSVPGAWVAIGLLAIDGGLWAVEVRGAVDAVLVAGVLSALVVYLLAGQQWPMPAGPRPTAQPRPTVHPRFGARPRRPVLPWRPVPPQASQRPKGSQRRQSTVQPKPVTTPRPAGLL